MIPPEVLSVGVILNTLPNTPECNEAKQKWQMAEGQLTKQRERISAILDPEFSYSKMRKRKIFVISDGHAGTFYPDPKTGEPMYTSVAPHMMGSKQYSDIVYFGAPRLDFSVVAQMIREFRQETLNKQEEVYVGTVHIFWSMLEGDGEPIRPQTLWATLKDQEGSFKVQAVWPG